jgi:hypothetical protein
VVCGLVLVAEGDVLGGEGARVRCRWGGAGCPVLAGGTSERLVSDGCAVGS